MDALDQSVGQIFETLGAANMLDNTIFVYTSDNGGAPFGFHGSRGFNWPLRGAKTTLWEGGVRAGAFIWSPLLKQPQRIANQLMHVVDWMVTLFGAVGQFAVILLFRFQGKMTSLQISSLYPRYMLK